MSESLQSLLNDVAAGKIAPDLALSKLQSLGYESIDEFAKIDLNRQQRTGFPEVIWGEDKTPAQIIKIIAAMRQRQSVVMATRITPAVYAELQSSIPDLVYYQSARICALTPPNIVPIHSGKITILTAGTADLPVAEEAACTASLCGFAVEKLWDVGVAGIHRLLSNRHVIDDADVLIIVPKTATPTKLPICRLVLKAPEAMPARPSDAELITAIVAAGIVKEPPTPMRTSGNRSIKYGV